MLDTISMLDTIAAALFGVVIGWVTYRTLRRNRGTAAISDIASVLGASAARP